MTQNLHHLAELWQQAKNAETEATSRRHYIEGVIAALIPGPLEGTASQADGGYKLSVTRKLNRTIDKDAYEQARELIPHELDPIRVKLDLDLRKLRAIEEANPAIFSLCQRFITVKPAKAVIEIKEVAA